MRASRWKLWLSVARLQGTLASRWGLAMASIGGCRYRTRPNRLSFFYISRDYAVWLVSFEKEPSRMRVVTPPVSAVKTGAHNPSNAAKVVKLVDAVLGSAPGAGPVFCAKAVHRFLETRP